jgi:hypothetical protein
MKKLFILSLAITCVLLSVVAPEVRAETPADTVKISKNFIKFNITSALLKNYSFQYERVLSRGISMAVTFKIMPESGIPYADNIIKWADVTDVKTQDLINGINTGNFTLTPEIRFYTGKKKYGRGFYFALFYNYGHYTFNNALISYETDLGNDAILNTSGNVSSHSGGFMLGAQCALGRHVCLDWWILGPHIGVSSGDITGLSSIPLTTVDQNNIKDDLNDIDIPMFKQTVDVTANKATMKFDGPWAGIRAGLSVGIKF